MRIRRLRNRSLSCMLFVTIALLAINFILVEHRRDYRGKGNDQSENPFNMSAMADEVVAPVKPVVPVLSHAKINIIMAYMRTGSSFAGVTLQEYPGTFYLYEPIRTIWEKFYYEGQPSSSVVYPDGTVVEHKIEDRDKVIMQEVLDYITCNFGNLSRMSLLDKFHRSKTKLMKRLRWCTEEHETQNGEDSPLTSSSIWRRCLDEVKGQCLSASVNLLKFIRIPLEAMRGILPMFPNMKILHLHRDPRGIFNSRAQLNDTPQTATDQEVVDHCNQWYVDLQVARDVAKEYPTRFKTVRYEDVTEHPPEAFTEISDFFGISIKPEIEEYLTKVTTASVDSGPWDFERANPYQTAMKWRELMNFTTAETICRICEKPMREMNYYTFNNAEDMANTDLPVRGPLFNQNGNVNFTAI